MIFRTYLFASAYGIDPPPREPLTILGPHGLSAFLEALGEAHGTFIGDPGFPLEVVELGGRDEWHDMDASFTLRTQESRHTEVSLAARVECDGVALAYTGDTGPSASLGAFLAGAQVLLAECSLPDPPPVDRHLSPRGVADLARTVAPELLVLTHVYPLLALDDLPGLVRDAGWPGPTVVAHDGLSVEMGRDAVVVTR